MNKLLKFLDCAVEGKNSKITLLQIRQIEFVYNELVAYRESKTISDYVKDVCVTAGLKVRPEGIGWIIHR